jgi:hypothetical protein
VKCLEHISIEEAQSLFEEIMEWNDSDGFSKLLVEECRRREMFSLAACISAWTRNWGVGGEGILDDTANCTDPKFVDHVMKAAGVAEEFDIIESLVDRCSRDIDTLGTPLTLAITEGHLGCSRAVLRVIDASPMGDSLLREAVRSYGDRNEMAKVCIEAGLSTHFNNCKCTGSESWQDCRTSPMITVLENGQKPVVQLLYKSGACSNKDLYRYFTNPSVTSKLTNMHCVDAGKVQASVLPCLHPSTGRNSSQLPSCFCGLLLECHRCLLHFLRNECVMMSAIARITFLELLLCIFFAFRRKSMLGCRYRRYRVRVSKG